MTKKTFDQEKEKSNVVELPIYLNHDADVSEILEVCEILDKGMDNGDFTYSMALNDTYYDPRGVIQGCTLLFTIDGGENNVAEVIKKIEDTFTFGFSIGIDKQFFEKE